MMLFIKTKSGWWPLVTLGLLMVTLWGSLLFNTFRFSSSHAQEWQKQANAYEEVLPNFLAPVIPKEVHKNSPSDEENFRVGISWSRLDLFKVWR